MGLSCRHNAAIALCQLSPPSIKTAKLQLFKFKELEAATGGFAKENFICKASHGSIYKGTLKDGRVVAVKRPTLGSRLWQDEDAFGNEIEMLSKLFSRRLVNLLGFSQDGKYKLLVVEFMVNGSLHDVLHSSHTSTLSWPMRVHLALQTAKAIRALHASSPAIIHRNIKPSNVFIDRHWNARLGDFGLALCASDTDQLQQRGLSSIPEIEPDPSNCEARQDDQELEYDYSSQITAKTDVFSFGMVLLEIMSGKTAISMDANFNPFSLLDWALPLIKQGNALAVCDPRVYTHPQCIKALKHWAAIAARCVRPSSLRRPSMEEVVSGLTKVSKLIPLPVWSGLPRVTKNQALILGMERQNTLAKVSKLIKLPLWTGFWRLRKKRALVVSLGKYVSKGIKLGRYIPRRFKRSPQSPKGTPKGAKVSDEGMRERGAGKGSDGTAVIISSTAFSQKCRMQNNRQGPLFVDSV